MMVKAPPVAWIPWALALAWSTGLPAFALAGTYARVRSGPDGTFRDIESLISENGNWVLILLTIPLVVTLLVGLALLLSRRRGAFAAAWSLTVLLIVLNALALLTIGFIVVPVTAALIATCSTWGILGRELSPSQL